jgi:hypothetical protein
MSDAGYGRPRRTVMATLTGSTSPISRLSRAPRTRWWRVSVGWISTVFDLSGGHATY